MPMNTGIEIGCPTSARAIKPPNGAKSSEPILTKGDMKRWYKSTSTANTSKVPEISATRKSPCISRSHS